MGIASTGIVVSNMSQKQNENCLLVEIIRPERDYSKDLILAKSDRRPTKNVV